MKMQLLLLEINDANNPEWPQRGVVEPTAALQVPYPERDVVEHSLPILCGLTAGG